VGFATDSPECRQGFRNMKMGLRQLQVTVFGIGFLLALFGCKNAQPNKPSQPQSTVNPAAAPLLPDLHKEYEQALVKAPVFAAMPDATLVAANQKDGLGLGLKTSATSFAVGAPIWLDVIYENLNARKPIASGMCRFVSVNLEDIDRQQVTMSQYVPSPCRKDTFYKNKVMMPKEKIFSMRIKLNDLSVYPDTPGHYLLNVSWQSVEAGEQTYLWGPTYSSIGSNAIPIVITPSVHR
jgi:hypothetical protein